MKNNLKTYFPIFLLLLCLSVQGQVSTNASGGSATGNGIVFYSVGEVFYLSKSGENGSVNEGVQHAYEITALSVNDSYWGISLQLYPNPVVDKLILEIKETKNPNYYYHLI